MKSFTVWKKIPTLVFIASVSLLGISACGSGPGSEEWCEGMMQKPNAEWKDQEAREFGKSCLYE